jgi:hypothetical protein
MLEGLFRKTADVRLAGSFARRELFRAAPAIL